MEQSVHAGQGRGNSQNPTTAKWYAVSRSSLATQASLAVTPAPAGVQVRPRLSRFCTFRPSPELRIGAGMAGK